MAITLFSLPFAGGNKFSYRCFDDHIPSFLNHVPLEYPGRGLRSGEPLLNELDRLTEDIYEQVKHSIDKTDYIIYGHSMGGLLTWLLTHKIIIADHRPPLHIFLSGTPGPSSLLHSDRKRYLLDRKDFIEELKSLDDSFGELFNHEELLDYFEPVLRSDFMACENYKYKSTGPLNTPLTVFYGDQDDIEKEEIFLWQKETRSAAEFIEMQGKHFFILPGAELLIRAISKKIRTHLVFG